MNIYSKLQAARVQLQGMKITKSGENKFAGYKYMELSDFIPAINTIFAEKGLCGVVSFTPEMAALTIHDTETPEQSIAFTSPMSSAALKGCHEVQNLGAVQTYLRRYLYVMALEIVEHDALDGTTGKNDPAPKVFKHDVKILKTIVEAKTVEELTTIWKEIKPDVRTEYLSIFSDAKAKVEAAHA